MPAATVAHGEPDLQDISLEVVDGIATITLQRPDSLNAFTDRMEVELLEALDRCDADDAVRAVVLTGAGRAFCAGMDLSASTAAFDGWRTDEDGEGPRMRRDGGGRVVLRMYELHKPIIAAINGPAVGVGITMTLAADVRIAAEDARMGFVFNRRGLVPESCSSWFLPRVVPLQTALEWVLTGRVFPAAEARAAGLVRSLHPRAELLEVAYALAAEIADNTAAVSVALARQMLWRMLGAQHPVVAHEVETHALNVRGTSDDAREGIAAFLEKRPARFPGVVSRDLPDVFAGLPAPEYREPLTSDREAR
ncbi:MULTISPECIES: crotonase/enoyl-CoA hydratase family protein [unclassified Blastococcus]